MFCTNFVVNSIKWQENRLSEKQREYWLISHTDLHFSEKLEIIVEINMIHSQKGQELVIILFNIIMQEIKIVVDAYPLMII